MLHMAWGQYGTPGPSDYTRYFKKSHPIPRDSPPRPGHLDPDDLVTPVFRRDVLPVIHKVRLGYYPPCVADCVPVLSIGFVSGSYTWNTRSWSPSPLSLPRGVTGTARPSSVGSIPFRCREDGFGFARN